MVSLDPFPRLRRHRRCRPRRHYSFRGKIGTGACAGVDDASLKVVGDDDQDEEERRKAVGPKDPYLEWLSSSPLAWSMLSRQAL